MYSTAKIPQVEIEAWLWQHIPFRVTAGIAGTPICDEWSMEQYSSLPLGLRFVCLNDATFQGRIAAIRWLIEFVGLQEKADQALGPQPTPSYAARVLASGRQSTDFGVGMLPGGVFLLPTHKDAKLLARTWKGCAQAIGHPTRNTGHPDLDVETLTAVMRILIAHLDATAYQHAKISVKHAVLTQVQLRFGRPSAERQR